MKSGFVYLWYDTKHKKYYLGSHLGKLNDGYTGSNRLFQSKYKNRPNSFKRRILEFYEKITSKDLLKREQIWLNMIKPEELTIRYYNEKNVASGGDIISNLSPEKRKEHSLKSSMASRKYWSNISEEDREFRRKNCFNGNKFDRSYMKERQDRILSKTAKVVSPSGEELTIKNVAEFCRTNQINYNNFKSVLRGERKSCKGFKGVYV